MSHTDTGYDDAPLTLNWTGFNEVATNYLHLADTLKKIMKNTNDVAKHQNNVIPQQSTSADVGLGATNSRAIANDLINKVNYLAGAIHASIPKAGQINPEAFVTPGKYISLKNIVDQSNGYANHNDVYSDCYSDCCGDC